MSDSATQKDSSPPGVPEILQAGTLEWVAISFSNARMHAKSLQSCLTLCNPKDSSPPGSSVPEILQAGILEWVAVSCSNHINLSCLIRQWQEIKLQVLALILFSSLQHYPSWEHRGLCERQFKGLRKKKLFFHTQQSRKTLAFQV